MQNLGTLGGVFSDGRAANANGSVVVGFSVRADGVQRAFRWTSAGMQDIGTLGGQISSAIAVDASGGVVVGSASTAANANRAFRWTSAGMQNLGVLPGGHSSDAYAVSADGTAVAGISASGPAGYRAFRWTTAGMENLGTLGGSESTGYGISGDGTFVVGDSSFDSSGSLHAFLWSSSLGMVDLNEYLPAQGVDLGGWTLVTARAISPDGLSIAGWGTINNETHGFIVRVPAPGAATVLAGFVLATGRRRSRAA